MTSAAVIALSVLRMPAAAAPLPTAGRLRLRAPDLERPLSERFPDPARTADPVKAAVFSQINADRARFGVAPVAWDEAASHAADEFCARQVQEKTRGHFLMDGIPPYGRMSFAGIFALHSQNSVSWITTARKFGEPTTSLALAGQEQMMEEKAPNDGHRVTILDPEATHVGVGYAISGGRFQMSQEFLTRRFERVTLAAEGSSALSVSGRTVAGLAVRFVTIAREPIPHSLTREEATARSSYSYPRPHLAYVPEGDVSAHVVGMMTEDRLRHLRGREFAFSFAADRPGLYTFEIYVTAGEGDRPRPGGAATVWFE